MSAATFDWKGGRESVPDSRLPPPGYTPELTPLQRARAKRDQDTRRAKRVGVMGGPRSLLSLSMMGLPCPGGWSSENGYNNRGCRCDGCREAHRVARMARLHRQAA